MSTKKYELIPEKGNKLLRLKALRSFRDVKEDDLGGLISGEENLSHEGDAWVYGEAMVSSNVRVSGNAEVSGNARVSGNAEVSGNARVSGNAEVSGNAKVYGEAEVSSNAMVFGNAMVSSNAKVSGNAEVSGNAMVSSNVRVSGNAEVSGNAKVYGEARVSGNAMVFGNAMVSGNAEVSGDAMVLGNARIYDGELLTRLEYIVLKNVSTSGRYYTYNFSSGSWAIGCFKGNTEELLKHLETVDTKQQVEYKASINFINELIKIKKDK